MAFSALFHEDRVIGCETLERARRRVTGALEKAHINIGARNVADARLGRLEQGQRMPRLRNDAPAQSHANPPGIGLDPDRMRLKPARHVRTLLLPSRGTLLLEIDLRRRYPIDRALLDLLHGHFSRRIVQDHSFEGVELAPPRRSFDSAPRVGIARLPTLTNARRA